MTRRRGLLAALGILAALGGCGGSDGPSPPPRPAERADKPPELSSDWRPYVSRAGGFVIGLPPGWVARDVGASTLIRSRDRLVSIQVSPDRTDEALGFDPDEFARRALAAVPGYRRPLSPGRARRYPHRYEGSSATARGVSARGGVAQRVELISLRREGVVAFTVLVAAKAGPESAKSRELAHRVVASLRSRPPGGR